MNYATVPHARHIEAALEASCETLVTLTLISTATREDERLRDQSDRAINSLRRVIAELRKASTEPASVLSYGFVLGDGRARFRAVVR